MGGDPTGITLPALLPGQLVVVLMLAAVLRLAGLSRRSTLVGVAGASVGVAIVTTFVAFLPALNSDLNRRRQRLLWRSGLPAWTSLA